MTITSTAGEVSITEVEEGKWLHVETDSGDITVSYITPPASLKLMAEGTIGNGSNTLELVSHAGTITVKTLNTGYLTNISHGF